MVLNIYLNKELKKIISDNNKLSIEGVPKEKVKKK